MVITNTRRTASIPRSRSQTLSHGGAIPYTPTDLRRRTLWISHAVPAHIRETTPLRATPSDRNSSQHKPALSRHRCGMTQGISRALPIGDRKISNKGLRSDRIAANIYYRRATGTLISIVILTVVISPQYWRSRRPPEPRRLLWLASGISILPTTVPSCFA